MRAITLWEPWATLWAGGKKVHETRSWPTKHRGLLAVHAAARMPDEAVRVVLNNFGLRRDVWLSMTPHMGWGLANGQANEMQDFIATGPGVRITIPAPPITIKEYRSWSATARRLQERCGRIVGVVNVADCIATESEEGIKAAKWDGRYGDWSPGRFAWKADAFWPLLEPIPAKGKQGFWTVPQDIEEMIKKEFPALFRACPTK